MHHDDEMPRIRLAPIGMKGLHRGSVNQAPGGAIGSLTSTVVPLGVLLISTLP